MQGRPQIIVVFNRLIRDAAVIGFTRLKWVGRSNASINIQIITADNLARITFFYLAQ